MAHALVPCSASITCTVSEVKLHSTRPFDFIPIREKVETDTSRAALEIHLSVNTGECKEYQNIQE
jgi:hypothetical protein